MTAKEKRGRRALGELLGDVAWELVAAAVIATIALVGLPSIGLPSIPTPDLPDLPEVNLPEWLKTVLRWGKFVVLAVLAIGFIAAVLERRKEGVEHGGN